MLVHQVYSDVDPERILFRETDQSVTYGTFKEWVAKYRNYFKYVGIQPGENVGLYCKNCPEFMVAYFAVVSLGAVIVPLNRTLTAREVAWIAADAGMKHLIAMTPVDLDVQIRQLLIPEISEAVERRVFPEAPEVAMEENQECVIIYTSGTTGYPKGAVLTHRNLVSNAKSFAAVVALSESDRQLCVLPMFHSFAWTVTVLSSLVKGGSITIMEMFQPKDALKTIRENQLTVVCGVPVMFNYYQSLGKAEDFASIRLFVSGGASLPLEIIGGFKKKFDLDIAEGYGLSEASPVVSVNPPGGVRVGSIGLPLPGIDVRIVGPEGVDVPDGEVGELYTRGPNVMKGYHNQPDVTAETVVDGWLHTGDLARLDSDGYIYIVDRLKDIIIVGGFNVYPREVEEVIYQYPDISEATVIGIPDRTRGEAPCACIVLREGVEFNRKAFMSFLQERLANFKIPRDVKVMDALPKNATGKIMKRELREQLKQG